MANMPESLHVFDTAEAAASVLAEQVAGSLHTALKTRGRASLIASGGSTPEPLYRRLSQLELEWEKVSVVLADERWVEPGETGSNEDFIRRTLIADKASDARLTGLKSPGAAPVDGLETTEARLTALPWPADCAILGMGDDGHTLSWFPHAQGLDAALSTTGGLAAAIDATPSAVTGALTRRITLTLRALDGVRLCALLISGKAKHEALAKALEPGPVEAMPIRALLRHPSLNLQIFWSP